MGEGGGEDVVDEVVVEEKDKEVVVERRWRCRLRFT